MRRAPGSMTIGELAKRTAVGVETIRFYERQGLLPAPERAPNGYRRYPAERVARLTFIRRARRHGFSLAEIGELAGLAEPNGDRTQNCGVVQQKIADIDDRLSDLGRVRGALANVLRLSSGEARVEDRIIESLAARHGGA